MSEDLLARETRWRLGEPLCLRCLGDLTAAEQDIRRPGIRCSMVSVCDHGGALCYSCTWVRPPYCFEHAHHEDGRIRDAWTAALE